MCVYVYMYIYIYMYTYTHHTHNIYIYIYIYIYITLRQVAGARALHAVVPIENSASGTLHSTYDLLIRQSGNWLGIVWVDVYCGG